MNTNETAIPVTLPIPIGIGIKIEQVVDELKERGYRLKLRMETTSLYCIDLDFWFTPDNFIVDEQYHFKDSVNPDGDRQISAISTLGGPLGYLVDPCFVYEDNISPEMMEKLFPPDRFANRRPDHRGYEEEFELETPCLYCSDLDMRLQSMQVNQ